MKTKGLLIGLVAASLFAQAPAITGVGSDNVRMRSARIHWTAGFYHDTASDATLTTGFTTTSIGFAPQLVVNNSSNLVVGNAVLIGSEWARVYDKVDSTHVGVQLLAVQSGAADLTEAFYSARDGMSISNTGTTGTVTLPYAMPSWWDVGHRFLIQYSKNSTLNARYTIATKADSTHFTFTTTGLAGGTTVYNITTDSDIWLESAEGTVHSSGETISNLGTDNMICYGDAGGSSGTYPNSLAFGYSYAAEQNKHYAFVTGQTPSSTIHYIVLSTPRQFGASNCASIGTHTGQSSDQTITFLSSEQTAPTAPSNVSFSTALPSSYDATNTTDNTCSTLQTLINNAAAATATKQEIRVPLAATCTGTWTLPHSAATTITIRGDSLDTNLPAPGACGPPLDPTAANPCISAYPNQLPTLQMPSGTPGPVFKLIDFQDANNYHLLGMKIQANPCCSYNSGHSNENFSLVDLRHPQGGGVYDHASHPSNIILDRLWFYQKNIGNGAIGAVYLTGGNNVAVVDSVTEGIGATSALQADRAAIQFEAQDTSDSGLVVRNSRIAGGTMNIYLGDNGWNTSDVLIEKNLLDMDQSRRTNSTTFVKQRSYPVSSATAGSTTAIVLSQEADIGPALGYTLGTLPVNFTGFTGNWTPLNAREFLMTDGTLVDNNCNGSTCAVTTSSAHGFTTGQYVWLGGVSKLDPGCINESAVHQITTDTSTTFHWTSSTVAHCIYPEGQILGPVFPPTSITDNTHLAVGLNSTGFTGSIGSPIMRYGFVISFKNSFEAKPAKRVEIRGNIIQGSFAGEQEGQCFTLTNRIGGSYQDVNNFASNSTISDFYLHDNWCRTATLFLDHLGVQDNGTSIIQNRVKISNNLATDITFNQCDLAGGACDPHMVLFSLFTDNMVFDHLTAMTPSGVAIANNVTPPPVGNWTFTNSIFMFGAQAFNGGSDIGSHGHLGSQIYQLAGTGASPNPPFPGTMLTWGRNVYIGNAMNDGTTGDDWVFAKQWYDAFSAGSLTLDYQNSYWPHGLAGTGFAGLTTISGATNANPIVLTTATMSCVPNAGDRVMVDGVKGNAAANRTYIVAAPTSTSLTLVASRGSGAYTSGGVIIPVTGKCNVADNWALSGSSPYKACAGGGDTCFVAPNSDTVGPPDGTGPASDGTAVGANISTLKTAMGVGGGGGGPVNLSLTSGGVRFTGTGKVQ